MRKSVGFTGFTIVEIIVITAVVGILAGVGIVAYGGWRERTAQNTVTSDLTQAQSAMKSYQNFNNKYPTNLTELNKSFTPSPDTSLSLTVNTSTARPVYSNLSSVQNGVLFHDICVDIISNPTFTTIHANDGQTAQVQTNCDDGLSGSQMQIVAWQSRTWPTPITKSQLTSYMASVPSDSYWVDRQQVVRGFYQELIDRFEAQGGVWPITSFWDSWANQWSGVPYQPLPTPSSSTGSSGQKYCIQAINAKYPSINRHVTSDGTIADGPC